MTMANLSKCGLMTDLGLSANVSKRLFAEKRNSILQKCIVRQATNGKRVSCSLFLYGKPYGGNAYLYVSGTTKFLRT